ncbi:WGxxGxxG family protein [Pannus brasiliensis CCIBt3594]|uniref:WGxxGxxG family protein n=1 Tax=Pannus brasiliensis CCIBt3594 TaxID=1427578 RepID=A0AAW9QYZ8_9CHRO
MKMTKISKIFGAGLAALTLANIITTLPASAQTNTAPVVPADPASPGTTTDGTARTDVNTTTYRDNDFDWGWLGLIGLAGLAGLAGRKRDETVTYRDPNPRESSYRD